MAVSRANSSAGSVSWTDARVEQVIGALLRTGVLISAAVVLIGGVLYLIQYGRVPAHYETFTSERAELRSIFQVVRGAWHLESRAVIQFGLLLLVATPVARVLFSAVAFWLERDRLYVGVTLIVLAILLYGLFGGTL
jgi:uncharacterized membrane protein